MSKKASHSKGKIALDNLDLCINLARAEMFKIRLGLFETSNANKFINLLGLYEALLCDVHTALERTMHYLVSPHHPELEKARKEVVRALKGFAPYVKTFQGIIRSINPEEHNVPLRRAIELIKTVIGPDYYEIGTVAPEDLDDEEYGVVEGDRGNRAGEEWELV